MRGIIMLVAMAGRRLAVDGVPLIDSRYARRLLVLSATLTAAMVVGLLGYAPSARADVACDPDLPNFCAEKTATPDPVKVGEPLTFTIREYCTATINCGGFRSAGMTDTLPEGLDFDSASATGFSGPEFGNPPQPTCTFSESDRTVTCGPIAFWFDIPSGTAVPFVATIEVIPRECGTFTNTANVGGRLVSETFTVEGCTTIRLSPGDDVYSERACPPDGDETVFGRGGDDTLLLNECGDTDNEPDPSDSDADVANGQGGNDRIRVDDGDIYDTARGGQGTDRCTGDLDLGDGVDDVDDPPIGPGGGTGTEQDVGDTLLCEQKTYVIGEFYTQS
jgi:hypothetical protein